MAVVLNDFVLCFIGTDPKHKCFVYSSSDELIYEGRIESLLYRSDEPLKSIGESAVNSIDIYEETGEDDEGRKTGDILIYMSERKVVNNERCDFQSC